MEVVSLGYRPHPGQLAVHTSPARFRYVCCGRRWGKTRLAAAELLDRAGREAAGDYGWIAPTYLIAERGVDACKLIGRDLLAFTGKAPTVATFQGAAGQVRLTFLSADNPDSILGFGFAGLVLDEAARIPRDVWTRNIRPTLGDRQGWALLISTPFGRNWFFDEFTRGASAQDPARASWAFPSNSSPYFPPGEWEDARRTLPSDIFRQEYEAAFLEDSAGAFRGIEACLLPEGAPPAAPRSVAIGLDLAKYTDWTVAIAMDRDTGRALDMLRFNTLEWPAQKARILGFARRWPGAVIIADATGAGDPIVADLRHDWPRTEPFVFTNPTKVDLIQSLAVAIEQGKLSWPREWETLTDELRRYEYEYTGGGRLTYSAPSGFHDDCVIALALANSLRREHTPAAPAPRPMAPAVAGRFRGQARALA
jgi:hypothetical protein